MLFICLTTVSRFINHLITNVFLAIKRIAFLIKANHSWKNIYAEGPAGHSHNSQLLKLWNWYLRRSYNVLFFFIKKVPHNVSAEFITHTHVWDLHQASHSQCETTRLDTEATVCNERSKPNTSFKWDRQHVSGVLAQCSSVLRASCMFWKFSCFQHTWFRFIGRYQASSRTR